MMKYLLPVILSILVANSVIGQIDTVRKMPFSEEWLYPDKYIDIPRTRVSIILPEDYRVMKNSTGLKKDDNTQISVHDMIGMDYSDFYSKNDVKTLESDGCIVYESIDTSICGFQANYYSFKMSKDINTYMALTFGDSTFSTMITYKSITNDIKYTGKIKSVLLSVKYNIYKVIDQFEGLGFTVDTNSTVFKLSNYNNNCYLFTPNGLIKEEYNRDQILILTLEYNSDTTIEEMSQMLISDLKKHGAYGFIKDTTYNNFYDDYSLNITIGDCYVNVDRFYYYQYALKKKDLILFVKGFCDFKNEDYKRQIEKFCNNIKIIKD